MNRAMHVPCPHPVTAEYSLYKPIAAFQLRSPLEATLTASEARACFLPCLSTSLSWRYLVSASLSRRDLGIPSKHVAKDAIAISAPPSASRRGSWIYTFRANSVKRNAKQTGNAEYSCGDSFKCRDLYPSTERKQVKEQNELANMVVKFVSSLVIATGMFVYLRPAPAVASASSALSTMPAGSTAIAAGGRFLSVIGGTELLASAWTGLVAGCLHTLTGPDHLAALAPLSIGRTRLESAAVGALWGCGHDAGQVLFGILFLFLKDRLHIEVLRIWGARVVGMTLLAIGALGIKEAQEVAIPCLAGDGSPHESILRSAETFKDGKGKIGLATFATGIVHGLQPDALLMVLPALALPSRLAGAAFLSMFLLGTVLAMGSYTALIGSCSQALQKRIPRITESLSWGSSLVAIFVGAAILVGELFGASLF